MSLRAAAPGLWRRSNLRIIAGEIASGEEQERPRNDIVSLAGEGTYIFTNPNAGRFTFGWKGRNCDVDFPEPTVHG
jgi:hypothetical protein